MWCMMQTRYVVRCVTQDYISDDLQRRALDSRNGVMQSIGMMYWNPHAKLSITYTIVACFVTIDLKMCTHIDRTYTMYHTKKMHRSK